MISILAFNLLGTGWPCPTRSYPDSQKYKYKIEIVDLFGVDCGPERQNNRLEESMEACWADTNHVLIVSDAEQNGCAIGFWREHRTGIRSGSFVLFGD